MRVASASNTPTVPTPRERVYAVMETRKTGAGVPHVRQLEASATRSPCIQPHNHAGGRRIEIQLRVKSLEVGMRGVQASHHLTGVTREEVDAR